MHPSRFLGWELESVVLVLVTCFWFPFPRCVVSWPSAIRVCKSATNPSSWGFMFNVLVASLSWGFAWVTESQQGWPHPSGQVWVLFLWSGLLAVHLKSSWAAKQCQLREFSVCLAGDLRQLGLVISSHCFRTVWVSRNQHAVVSGRRRRTSGGYLDQPCPEQGPRPELEFSCLCIPLGRLVSPGPCTRLFLIWFVRSVETSVLTMSWGAFPRCW